MRDTLLATAAQNSAAESSAAQTATAQFSTASILPASIFAALILSGLGWVGLDWAGLSARVSHADGKFYVPLDEPQPGEPFQRALILYEDGKEFLLVQPSATGSTREFGWVLPVPSVPAVGYCEHAGGAFVHLALRSRPDVIDVGSMVQLLLVAALLAGASVAFVRSQVRLCLVLLAIGLLFSFFITISGVSLGDPHGEVEVLASKRVGMYDTSVVRPDGSGALRAWLDEQGFVFDASDEVVFESYVQRGWCFVVSRLAPDSLDTSGGFATQDGLLPALALLFDSDEPVYPYALTATAGHAVEVVLYVAAEHRVEGHPLETEYAGDGSEPDPEGTREIGLGPTIVPGRYVEWVIGVGVEPASAVFTNAKWLTKLRGTLQPGDLTEDLVLSETANTPVRRSVWR